MSFSENQMMEVMRVERARRCWTRQELADRLRVDKMTVRNWETGVSTPSLAKACEMADVFDLSLDVIAGRKTVA